MAPTNSDDLPAQDGMLYRAGNAVGKVMSRVVKGIGVRLFNSEVKSICSFCTLPPERVLIQNEWGIVFRDGFPVSPGHTLVIPKRHIGSFFDLTTEEREAILILLDEAKKGVDTEFAPDAYNIGINDGPAAGQTVPHLHIHLIPRYKGDREDPRGGVRWVIPEKANYWNKR